MANPRQPVGWTAGLLKYIPYYGNYWYTQGVTGAIRETVNSINNVVNNPQAFAEQFVRGAIRGTREAEQQGNQNQNLIESPSLLSRVQQLAMHGASGASVVVLEQLLENAQVIDEGDEAGTLREDTLEELRAAQNGGSIQEIAGRVWSTLNSRHIVWGGMHLNPTRSSSQILRQARLEEEPQNDGVNPIESLIRCQEKYRAVRIDHHLAPPPPSESIPAPQASQPSLPTNHPSREEMAELIGRTDEVINQFCEKTIHFSTLYAMRTLFNHEIDPNEMLQGGGNIEARYLTQVGGGRFRQFIYRHAYHVIMSLIGPLIKETIHSVTSHLREFFNDNVSMLNFAETKIKDLARYYGRVERGRQEFLTPQQPQNAGYGAGDFSEFLEMTMRTYGVNGLTEAELIKRFEDYIVINYTPSPQIEIRGYRIPIISKLVAWIVHSIRKGLVRFFLRKTDIVNTILTRGTGSAQQAGLGLKRILRDKLTDILEVIHRSRGREVTNLSENEEVNSRMGVEMRKAQLITRELHQVIQQHSHNLHRFIDIQACNNSEQSLRNLDNRINTLTSEIVNSLSSLFQWEPFSLQTVLENATTNMIETALLSIFEDKERQIEAQMQGIFSILEKSYEYIPHEERFNLDLRYREESRELDDTLNGLLEQLTRTSIESSIEDHLKNASLEKHRQTVEFIEKEREEQVNFADFLGRIDTDILNLINDYKYEERTAHVLKEQINQAVGEIERYLRRIASTLRSKELAGCYTDTKGDLYNSYACQIHVLEELAKEKIVPFLQLLQELEQGEEKLASCLEALKSMGEFSCDLLQSELAPALNAIAQKLPETARPSLQEPLNTIQNNWGRLNEINRKLRLFQNLDRLQSEDDSLNNKIRELEGTRRSLSELSLQVREYHHIVNAAEVSERGRALLEERIGASHELLLETADSPLYQNVLQLIDVEDMDSLYQRFHPAWSLSSRAPIFVSLDRYSQGLQQQRNSFQQQIHALQVGLQSENRTRLESEKIEESQAMRARFRTVRRVMRGQTDRLIGELNHQRRRLKDFKNVFEASGDKITVHAGALRVSGCIAVGELQFTRHKGLIIAAITERITAAINHLLDSLGKPFHYKQLVLRMVVQDIVNRGN